MHGTGSGKFVYNKRRPRFAGAFLFIGEGRKLRMEWFGSLDVVLLCKDDVRVTLENVAVVPGLALDLMPFNCIQEKNDILMNHDGNWILNSGMHFVKLPAGNYIQATRVEHGAGLLAMVAAMMQPGQQRSINSDDLHVSLGHTNDTNACDTAKQVVIKVKGTRGYCDGCGEAEAIRRAVPRENNVKSGKPLQRVFIDLTGPYPPFADGTRYCILVVDDNTNVGWPLFLRDKSGPTICHAFYAWHNAVKLGTAIYGGLDIARFGNGYEFTNAEFRKLLIELGIAVEYTPVDGEAQRPCREQVGTDCRRGQGDLAGVPVALPRLGVPQQGTRVDQDLAGGVYVDERLHQHDGTSTHTGQAVPVGEAVQEARNPSPPVVNDGGNPPPQSEKKTESKGEWCFYLNTGNDHSSTTHNIFLSSGVCSYSADVTWGYRHAPFVGQVLTWRGGAVVDASAAASAAAPAAAKVTGSGVFPAASVRGVAGVPASSAAAAVILTSPVDWTAAIHDQPPETVRTQRRWRSRGRGVPVCPRRLHC